MGNGCGRLNSDAADGLDTHYVQCCMPEWLWWLFIGDAMWLLFIAKFLTIQLYRCLRAERIFRYILLNQYNSSWKFKGRANNRFVNSVHFSYRFSVFISRPFFLICPFYCYAFPLSFLSPFLQYSVGNSLQIFLVRLLSLLHSVSFYEGWNAVNLVLDTPILHVISIETVSRRHNTDRQTQAA